MRIDEMLVENRVCPLGVDVLRPAFGWSFRSSTVRAQRQTAYRIVVSGDEESVRLGRGDIWDSGKTPGPRHVDVPYDGPPLHPRMRYYWKLQVWDENGAVSESPVSWWEIGLLSAEDWSARWIGAPEAESGSQPALPLFRHEFTLDKPAARARAYICGLGQFELRLNGNKVSENVLEPGWTNYDKTVLYCVYDITDEIRVGANAVGIMLGNGFYNVTGGRYTKFKGSFGAPKCLVQLEITHTDGTTVTVSSADFGWRTAPGPVTFSCIYGGEDFDARLEQAG